MTVEVNFEGFFPETIIFFDKLKKNNDKIWFDKHRDDYENFVLEPSRQYVMALGRKLRKVFPSLQADPRVNKSLFKIYRDTRFAKDKRPFKTNLGLWFWEGGGARMECSGFYVHIEPGKLMLANGIYMFSKPQLEEFRQSVVHKTRGSALQQAIKKTVGRDRFEIGGTHYKKVPRGFDPEHKRADLLLHNALYAMSNGPIPAEFYTPGFVDYSFKIFKAMGPLHKWLVDLTQRV
jgi:uncharacterized protein (TIGR02453 family)